MESIAKKATPSQPVTPNQLPQIERAITDATAIMRVRFGRERDRLRNQCVKVARKTIAEQVQFMSIGELLEVASRYPRIATWQIDGPTGRPMKFLSAEDALRAAITGFLVGQLADEFASIAKPQLSLLESVEVAQ